VPLNVEAEADSAYARDETCPNGKRRDIGERSDEGHHGN
jgi:hypothetical protein